MSRSNSPLGRTVTHNRPVVVIGPAVTAPAAHRVVRRGHRAAETVVASDLVAATRNDRVPNVNQQLPLSSRLQVKGRRAVKRLRGERIVRVVATLVMRPPAPNSLPRDGPNRPNNVRRAQYLRDQRRLSHQTMALPLALMMSQNRVAVRLDPPNPSSHRP